MLTLWGPNADTATASAAATSSASGRSGLGGLTLPDVLRLRAQGGRRQVARGRSSWSAWRAGPATSTCTTSSRTPRPTTAASSSRSRRNVPGFDICELMPAAGDDRRQAGPGPHRAVRRADAARTAGGLHRLPQGRATARRSARSSAGSAAADRAHAVATSASTSTPATTPSYENPQYVGAAHRPFLFGGAGGQEPRPDAGHDARPALDDRRRLLAAFDGLRRDLDARGERRGHGRLHRPGLRHHHLAQGPRGVRPEPRAGQGPRARTAPRTTSTSTATTRRRRIPGRPTSSCWPGGWSRRASRS